MESWNFGSAFLAIGPVVIIGAGVIASAALASVWEGRKRWLVLLCGPAATLAAAAGST